MRRMRLVPLIAATYFMVSGGPYGIEDILGGAGYTKALIILVLFPFLWSFPTALMLGELTSAIPSEGGFYVWVRRAMGPFWGYQEAWLSLMASIFDMAIYPTLFVLYLGKLFPTWTAGSRSITWEVVLVAICCLWNLCGAPAVGEGSVTLFVLLLSPFAVLVVLCFLRSPHWQAHATAFTGGSISTAVIVALWNYMGWDNASTVAEEVENPRRNYPLAMLSAAGLVAISYILPVLALAYAGVAVNQFTTGSWTDAAHMLGGPLLGIAVVVCGMISGLGMFNALVMSYTRLPMVLAHDGMLPSWMALKNRRGVPWVAIIVCGIAWAAALGFRFEELISIDLILYGSSLLLEFVALAVLRFKEPDLQRPFRAGNLFMACTLGLPPALLIAYVMYAARDERMAHMPALLFGFLIALAGPIFYWISRKRWGQKAMGESALAPSGD
ncbi:APC family permease [Alloacidobacterium sp.]|uniref:APC family permease n=1 Tax=Alloacidobacterium sp. TaxID=2951999 RepID=UPI002D6E38F2|nr:APC family permease [Alloacidobacterium sp.]HYK34703.1 APC family permease [Alloacidobacterium sp.]